MEVAYSSCSLANMEVLSQYTPYEADINSFVIL